MIKFYIVNQCGVVIGSPEEPYILIRGLICVAYQCCKIIGEMFNSLLVLLWVYGLYLIYFPVLTTDPVPDSMSFSSVYQCHDILELSISSVRSCQ